MKDETNHNAAVCSLFHLFENTTVNDALVIDTSCGNTCIQAW